MTLAINHKFTSIKGDGTDTSLLRPSNWNDTHAITLATNNLVGRASAGSGAAEEIPVSAATIALLAATDIAAILTYLGISPPTTGDGRLTLKTTPTTGWLMMDDGTIGDFSSGASNRFNADTQPLFSLLYNNVSDANAQLLTSGGAGTTRAAQGTAAAAFAAHCRMSLPRQLGRAIVGAGTGSGLTTRGLGAPFGVEVITLSLGQIPAGIVSSVSVVSPTSQFLTAPSTGFGLASFSATPGAQVFQAFSQGAALVVTPNITSTGSAASINTGGSVTPMIQPSVGWNVMVKL